VFNDLLLDEKLLARFKELSGEAYLTGGSVRDIFLNKKPEDLDFLLTGVSEQEFARVFSVAKKVGKSFAVYKVGSHDIVVTEKDLLRELARRDFTINAMALNLRTEELIDPYGGLNDLNQGKIRPLPDSLDTDPLRIYRGARFVSQLSCRHKFYVFTTGFLQQVRDLADKEILSLPAERVYEELRKALASQNPELFFQRLRDVNLLKVHFKEIDDLIGVEQSVKYHPEGDVYNHTMQSLQHAVKITEESFIRFAVLVHDMGKAVTPENKWPHHYRHDSQGVLPFKKLAKRLKLPQLWRKAGQLAIEEHMRGYRWQEMKPAKIVRLFEKAARNPLGIAGLAKVIIADHSGRGVWQEDLTQIEKMPSLAEKMFNATTGLNFSELEEGPAYGEKIFEARVAWVKENC